jgi:hypothetical protein
MPVVVVVVVVVKDMDLTLLVHCKLVNELQRD